jgi:hypothetical protein
MPKHKPAVAPPHCHIFILASIGKASNGIATSLSSRAFMNPQQLKKNGEKRLHFDDFSVLLLNFFSIKLLFLGQTRDL